MPADPQLCSYLGVLDDVERGLIFSESNHWDPNCLLTSEEYFERFVHHNLDQAIDNTYATGTYGPATLPMGWWKITYHVPQGYVATTPTEISVNVPGKDGGRVAYAYLGLYPTRSTQTVARVLPTAGAIIDPVVIGMLAFLGLGSLGAVGLGIKARRKK